MTDEHERNPAVEIRRAVVLPRVTAIPDAELFSPLSLLLGEAAVLDGEPVTNAVVPVSRLHASVGRDSRGRLVVLGVLAAAVLVAVPVAVMFSQGRSEHHHVKFAAGAPGPGATYPGAPVPSRPSSAPSPGLPVKSGTPDSASSPVHSTPGAAKPSTTKGGSGGATPPPNGPVHNPFPPVKAGSTRLLVSYASHRCIDVSGGIGKVGTPLDIWDCGRGRRQRWRFEPDGTVRAMGKCMDAARGSSDNGTVIRLARCHGGPAQQFDLNGAGDLVNTGADKCVDVKDQQTGNGTPLQLWSCGGTTNQKWSAV